MGHCLNFSLDLCEKDATRRDGANNDHKDFGNIKTLIDKEWCQKHHYIHMEKDENSDEFSSIYNGNRIPKLMITTKPRPTAKLHNFIEGMSIIILYNT